MVCRQVSGDSSPNVNASNVKLICVNHWTLVTEVTTRVGSTRYINYPDQNKQLKKEVLMHPIESILQFPNPNTPDLGCFVRRKHEFQTDPDVDFQNVHVEFNPSIDFNPKYHHTYFRVMCWDAEMWKAEE